MAKTPKTSTAMVDPVTTTDRVTYDITETAPPFIAGQRVGDRKEIELTEDQARNELLSGHIRPKSTAKNA
ncbi:hypothetical protein AM571_CH03316 [Rhizobium etli 8C-3]|uniref:Uncharacterized protein n=1 Tax=Rhizobium etli 8C-3 TaxID=538025 RepID=A0A1L5P7K6_RHIET|nr:hypothetical protein [Rhizobium etli]APO76110.1 hypothetical protein AM571_CH03316 [Rhizobium etli 8C-3]